MYVRGFFKLHQIPLAIQGSLLLALSLLAGYWFTTHSTSYRRTWLALPPFAHDNTDSSAGNATPNGRSALVAAYALNCAAIAVAIFHAGVFPLYQSKSQERYRNKLQDNLASFGWGFLSLHHVANCCVLTMLLGGNHAAALLAPLALLLPISHFALRVLPALPPSMHFNLGLYVDLATHVPLAALYAWRAVVLGAPAELLGTAAELLHLASVVPEAVLHKNSKASLRMGRTTSWHDPWGTPSKDDFVLPEEQQQQQQQQDMKQHQLAPAGKYSSAGSGNAEQQQGSEEEGDESTGGGSGRVSDAGSDTIAARVHLRHHHGAAGTTTTTNSNNNNKLQHSAQQEQKQGINPANPPPVYPWLVLINCCSFFCFGGAMAITGAPLAAAATA